MCLRLFYKKNIIFNIEKYDKIIIKLRDYVVLTQDDITFISSLPIEHIMNIIQIYNKYTDIISELTV